MSKNVAQVFAANPITTISGTDLIYIGQGGVTDAAINGTNFIAQFALTTQVLLPINQLGAGTTLLPNHVYITNHGAALVTYILPVTAAIGTIVKIIGFSSGGWMVAQAAGQQIFIGNQNTTLGALGTLASTNQNDCIELVCVVANTTFTVNNVIGNITVV